MKRPLIILTIAVFSFLSIFGFANQGAMVTPPYDAPAITAVDQDGAAFSFSDAYKKGVTVVFFYPKADTPGCTKQSCSLRDAHGDLGSFTKLPRLTTDHHHNHILNSIIIII